MIIIYLLISLQSGFIPGDSTVNQLTYLYDSCTFCQALDSGKEIRVVLCDVNEAFDRVWHEGLLLLGPLLFLLFINDILVDIVSHIRLFADDTSLYMAVYIPDTAAELFNLDINKIMIWAKKWLVYSNLLKLNLFL